MCSLRDLSISITMEVQLVCLHLLLTQCDSDLTLGMLKKKKEKRRASEIECVGSLTALTLLQLCAAITRKLTESTLAESESCSSHI